jgi:hypothetical protein
MDSLAFGVAIATHNGNLLYTNSYFLEMFGHFNGFLAWLRLRLERSSSSVDLEMLTVSTRLSSAEINWCAELPALSLTLPIVRVFPYTLRDRVAS